MKIRHTVLWLSALIAVLALVAAGAGLFWPEGGSPFWFTTVRGETVLMNGQGLYHYDSLFSGAGYRGQDAVTLVLGVPLLALTALLYRRGSLRGSLLHLGILAYMLYVYASMALGAAYNPLFLVYVALLSASLSALVLALVSIDPTALSAHFSARLPRRGPAAFMFAGGAVTLVVWLSPLLMAATQGQPPDLLGASTTMVTDALDLAIIVPSTFVCGALMLHRAPLGYVLAFPLLGIILMLVPVIALSTVSQITAGISFSPGEVVGPVAGFLILGVFAIWVMVAILRNISEPAPAQAARS